jgi:hypothetical protein
MRVRCECGEMITDGTDGLPYKAHFIPDEDWFGIFEAMDKVLVEVREGRLAMNDAQMAVRRLHLVASRKMWQCTNCGRLLVSDPRRHLNTYQPISDAESKEILKSDENAVASACG